MQGYTSHANHLLKSLRVLGNASKHFGLILLKDLRLRISSVKIRKREIIILVDLNKKIISAQFEGSES